NSAVIDSGTRQIVLVAHGEGRFEPRDVKLGGRSENHIEVLQGIKASEQVVVAANFLIDAESNLKTALDGFGHADHNAKPVAAPASVGHRTEGTVEGLDPKENTVTLSHDPVPSLKWPAMTMDFKLANPALQQALKPGAQVSFEFVERQPGEWVITAVQPAGTAATAKAHTGH
ncbi:MAG: efflux RND transporter periplasmic adaptor subunit, partial [Rhodocyclaceae bacterium]